MIRNLLKDGAVYSISALLTRGIALLLIPVYTRVLSPSEYGAFDLLIVFSSLVSLTVALEVSQGVARYFSDSESPAAKTLYASTSFWFSVMCYSCFAFVCLAFSDAIAPLVIGRVDTEGVFRLGVIYIWLNGLFYLVQNQFRWEFKSRHFAAVSLLVSVSTALLSVYLMYVADMGLRGLLLGMIVGTALGLGYGLWFLRRSYHFLFSVDALKSMLAFSLPLVPSGIAVFLSAYVDRIMINAFLGLDDVGVYAVGFRIASIATLVIVGFQRALTPLVYSAYREDATPGQLAQIFQLFVYPALLLFLCLTMFAGEIVQFLASEEYAAAAQLIWFLVPAVLFSQMYLFAPGLAIYKKTKLILLINTAGALLNILLNWILIPRFGINGAAIASMLAYIGVFCFHMVLSQRYYRVPHKWMSLIFAVTSVAIIAWVGAGSVSGGPLHLWLRAAILGAVVVLLFAGGLLSVKRAASALPPARER